MAGSNTSLANASSPVHQPQAQGSPRWPSLLTSRLRPSSPPLLLSACCLGRAGRSEPHGVQWGSFLLVGSSSRMVDWGLCLIQTAFFKEFAEMPDKCSLNPWGYIFHKMPQNILAPYKWKNVKPTSYYSWLFSVVLWWKNKLFLTLGFNLHSFWLHFWEI